VLDTHKDKNGVWKLIVRDGGQRVEIMYDELEAKDELYSVLCQIQLLYPPRTLEQAILNDDFVAG